MHELSWRGSAGVHLRAQVLLATPVVDGVNCHLLPDVKIGRHRTDQGVEHESDSLTINLLASLADQELALVRGNANDLDFIPIIESGLSYNLFVHFFLSFLGYCADSGTKGARRDQHQRMVRMSRRELVGRECGSAKKRGLTNSVRRE